MFSPYYAWARRRGSAADPLRFCALNVSIYGTRSRWSMTEHSQVLRDSDMLAIGRSLIQWQDDQLIFEVDEFATPLPRRIRGQIRVHPAALTGHTVGLDAAGLHRWRPIAPRAWVEVSLEQPALRWSGVGYLDSNDGDGPLEDSFARWDWARAPLTDSTGIVYDVTDRHGADRALALSVGRDGAVAEQALPPRVALPHTRWRLPRFTRAESASLTRTVQDSPFYARSVVQTHLFGESSQAMHESLDLDRFSAPWTQAMLPFRIPRALS